MNSVLELPTKEVGYQGGTLKVTPLRIGQIPAFSRVIGPMFSALANVFTSTPLGDGGGEGGNPIKAEAELMVDAEELLQLMGQHGDQLIEAVAIATANDTKTISAGTTLEFFDLLQAVIEVNADFFARAMAKAKVVGRKPSSS